MGAIAEGLVAYAQPLLDQTDGSEEQLNKAFTISQLCFNLALLPEDSRDTTLSEMRPALKMDDEEFDAFRRSIVAPMIRRHQEMFPQMHRRVATDPSQSGPSPRRTRESRRPPKRTLEPTVTHRVRVIAAKNTSSVAARGAADSRPRARPLQSEARRNQAIQLRVSESGHWPRMKHGLNTDDGP